MGKPFLTTPSLPRFVVIGSGQRLGLRASKLSTDGCSNPQDSGIERCVVRRSLVVGRTRSLPTLPPPCRRSLVRIHRIKAASKLTAKVRNSYHRLDRAVFTAAAIWATAAAVTTTDGVKSRLHF